MYQTSSKATAEAVGNARVTETEKYSPKRQVSHHTKIALEAIEVFFL